jgi:hypothetical protein
LNVPLKPGSSRETIGQNIATEIRHGHDPKQVAAIAYKEAGKSRDAITSAGQETLTRQAVEATRKYVIPPTKTRPGTSGMDAIRRQFPINDSATGRKL